MNKLTTSAAIAGLLSVFTAVASQAAILNHVPNQNVSSEANDADCAAVMGYMRTPGSAEILGLTSTRVAIIPVCEDLTVPGRNNYGPLFVNGNAELLRRPIARTPALINALQARQYDQNDVVSVRFGANDSVILYVHQREMK